MVKIQESQYSQVIDLYVNGKSPLEIAKEFNVSPSTIRKILHKTHTPLRKRIFKSRFEEAVCKEIIKFYISGNSIKETCEKYNILEYYLFFILKKYKIEYEKRRLSEDKCLEIISEYNKKSSKIKEIVKKFEIDSSTIYEVLKRYNIKAKRANRFYSESFNAEYLNSINSHDKAYILGLFYADGDVSTEAAHITLEKTDRYLLETISIKMENKLELSEFTQITKVNKKIGIYCRLNFYCRGFVNNLISLGCKERKSLILEFPSLDIVPDEFIWSFIRGHFDGDGSVYLIGRKNPYGRIGVEIVGSIKFIKNLQQFLFRNNIETTVKKQHKCLVIRFNRQLEIKKFYEKLYSTNTNLYMIRKKNMFENWYDKYKERFKKE